MIPEALEDALAATACSGEQGEQVVGPGGAGRITLDGRELINMASCDYLGFAHHPEVLLAAHNALGEWGLGMAAGRILSGTTTLHRELEQRLASWVGCDDAVLYATCWTANAAVLGGLATFGRREGRSLAVFSDRLNHASIIDGIRGQRADVAHLGLFDHLGDLDDLRRGVASAPARAIPVIITDGVFSMEGDQAPLSALRGLAEQFDALLIVDDSHGTGVVGALGRGTTEAQDLLGRVDVITGTLGKALGGAIGGFVAGPNRLTTALRAVSRPYTFSTNPPPSVIAAAIAALDLLAGPATPLPTLHARVHHLRTGIEALGMQALPGDHPIVPVVVGAEDAARTMSADMISHGVFATALTFPVVPRGHARLRLQVSAAHSEPDLDRVLTALSGAHRPPRMRTAS